MGSLFLIRHGQASFGEDDYDRISDLGIRQSFILGDYFRKSGTSFEAVYSGTLRRHIATAESITLKAGADVFPEAVLNPCFNEFDAEGIFSGYLPILAERDPDLVYDIDRVFSDNAAFQKIFSRLVGLWISGLYAIDGVESWALFLQRVYAGLELTGKHKPDSGNIAVVTSGGVIAAAMKKAIGLDDAEAIRESWKCLNCAVSVLDSGYGQLTLKEFNSVRHFEIFDDKRLLTYR